MKCFIKYEFIRNKYTRIYGRVGFIFVIYDASIVAISRKSAKSAPSIHSFERTVYCHRCNAKFLWKRIPSDIKAGDEELKRIWLVAKRMWKRDWPAVHVALNTEWSDDIKEIMVSLKCELISNKTNDEITHILSSSRRKT